MHPPPIILHHHQRWCLRHHIFFYCKPEASYIIYPSYTELSYTTQFWNSLYMVCSSSPQHIVIFPSTWKLSSSFPHHTALFLSLLYCLLPFFNILTSSSPCCTAIFLSSQYCHSPCHTALLF